MPRRTAKTAAELCAQWVELQNAANKALLKRHAALKSASLAEIHSAYEDTENIAKGLYQAKDIILARLVRLWKKNKRALVDETHYLDVEDQFRGQVKAFAPGFAHRYKLKFRAAQELE